MTALQPMKLVAVALLCTALSACPVFAAQSGAASGMVEISFRYQRQSGMGSNQFAVWVEDSSGHLVKTLIATNFTAGRGGWEFRPQSIPDWVAASGIAEMSQKQIDAVSRATPPAGQVMLKWDLDNAQGDRVSAGEYMIILEGTLRGENRVLYKARLNLDGIAAEARPQPEYFGPATAERTMLADVIVTYTP